MNKYSYYQKLLEKKREQKEYNQLRCFTPPEEPHGPSMINFASNDFLGLSEHPYVKKNTIKYVLEWGAGTTPSRLVTQHLECHRSVEEKLAELVGKETSLLFPSTYQMHQQILSTLAPKDSLIFIDRFSNPALIQAAIGTRAKVFRFEHQNYTQLSDLLEKTESTSTAKLILTESLFSLNGEMSDLKKLSEFAEKFGALLYIEDSNAVSMLGKHGMGLASHRRGVDIATGSFGKGSGSFGAFVTCNALMREYLITFNPQLLETTMLPPAVLGAINGALDLIPDMQVERQKVQNLSAYLRDALKEDHWDIGNPSAHLIPLISLEESHCQKLSRALSEKNILATFLRPPTVPQGASRLRFTIHAHLSQEDLSLLLKTLKMLKEEPSLSIV